MGHITKSVDFGSRSITPSRKESGNISKQVDFGAKSMRQWVTISGNDMKSSDLGSKSTGVQAGENDFGTGQTGYDPKSLKKLPFEGGIEPLGHVPDRPASAPGGCRGLSWSLIANHQALNRC